MSKWVDKTSVIEAATIYDDGTLVGADFKVTLPEVIPVTAEVSGLMGTMNIPLLNTLESTEMTITKVGVDKNAARMNKPGTHSMLVKWVQDRIDDSANVTPVGCSASIKCLPKAYMPGASLEPGSPSEFDCTYEVSEYKLTVDGVDVFHMNRITGTLKVWDGTKLVDCNTDFDKYL